MPVVDLYEERQEVTEVTRPTSSANMSRSLRLLFGRIKPTNQELQFRYGYYPASVATSFQLGSREGRLRAKVQMSVTSATFSGSPSITVPVLSRVTEMICDTNRTVICAMRLRSSTAVMSGFSIVTNRLSAPERCAVSGK